MREVVENKVEITKQEARDLVERCLKVLYYRDARSYNRVSSLQLQLIPLLQEVFRCLMTVKVLMPLNENILLQLKSCIKSVTLVRVCKYNQ